MAAHFHEHTSRSLVKALTFRALVLTSDFCIIYLITHRYDLTTGLVLFSNLSSTGIYFFHERLWNRIHWGKSHKK